MELTRRDALTALGAAGITATAGCSSLGGGDDEETTPMESLVALGDTVYPSAVEVSEEFVQTYLFGRIYEEDAYQEELVAGTETLDEMAEEEFGSPFASLERADRQGLITDTELRSGDSVPDGSDVERVNYHLIDELLFAFYSSPKGGELVGNTNPRGWPGGFGYSPELSQ